MPPDDDVDFALDELELDFVDEDDDDDDDEVDFAGAAFGALALLVAVATLLSPGVGT